MARILNKNKQFNGLLKKKVLVGLSGGVDSSVAALLLKRKGFDVVGGYMNLEAEDNRCCSLESRNRAKAVADVLGIPFYSFDMRKEFRKKIVSKFVDQYKRNITPNPCVDCNKEIKFGLFLEKALALEFDYVATGHYIRKDKKDQTNRILKGKDPKKDQSYFLWRLNQTQLDRILFPLGEYTKEKTRELAKKYNLPTFDAKESQEVCFVKSTVAEFLKERLGERKGKIINLDGNELGNHQGIYFYTIGQRKGLGLSGGPYFVVGKDIKKNYLIVSKNESDFLSREVFLDQVNWVSGKEPDFPIRARVKIRYGHKPALAEIRKNSIIFDVPQKAITAGQSAVFYKGIELIGGGVICE
ncbi:MAG: tRNA 2-thiouridine(34) synthase MnmA [Candidatus Nealsonbacteria bacterium]|nr:tRNA 2-thiouridine(34) synthase MnmA [Candidatus Nealsonbacteria bacterium]